MYEKKRMNRIYICIELSYLLFLIEKKNESEINCMHVKEKKRIKLKN
jgi:hypothetical protein